MTNPAPIPAATSNYADCLEAIRDRLAARESRLFGIAVLVVYVHQVEQLFASAGAANATRMLDELRNRLSQVNRPGDYFARLGDRKFVYVLSNLRNEGHALLTANKIHRTGSELLTAGGQHTNLRLSIGMAMFPAHARTSEQLMQCAEIALLEAWKSTQTTVVYTARQAEQLAAGWNLETQLANALEHGELVLNYQPKLALADMTLAGAEALMRWNRADSGNVPPDIFIDVAEMTGQIDPLTRFAFERAMRQMNEWPKSLGPLGVAVNVTPSIIRNRELVDVITNAASACSIELSRLTVEVTENALMVDRELSHNVLTELRSLGVRVSIDDFGTGYSSLAYLKEIPADELKIDKSFVMNMLASKADRKVVEQIVALGHAFGLVVVAEGVENETVSGELTAMGCDFAQGFHYAKPLPPDAMPRWAGEWRAARKT
ncbi:MAG: GGDEF domain-containing phosphodiesterase [Pseudomonadota bacterium]|nr:GGDEF domain-containing phosphodiesterase [Pseudomonadota bacterium]